VHSNALYLTFCLGGAKAKASVPLAAVISNASKIRDGAHPSIGGTELS